MLHFVVVSSSTFKGQKAPHQNTHFNTNFPSTTTIQATEHTPDRIDHKSKALERKPNGHLTLANHKNRTILPTRHLPTESTYINVAYYDPRSKQASASLIPT
jgi:hypothetical protein